MSRRSLLLQVALVAVAGALLAGAAKASSIGAGSANLDGGSAIIVAGLDCGHAPMINVGDIAKSIDVVPIGHRPVSSDKGWGGVLPVNVGDTSCASLGPKFEDVGDRLGEAQRVKFATYQERRLGFLVSKGHMRVVVDPTTV